MVNPFAVILFGGGALVVLLGLVVLSYGLMNIAAGRRIRAAEPDTATDAVSGGRVNLEGKAVPLDKTLEGPVSGDPCLGYECEVERQSDGGAWRAFNEDGETVPFLLETEDGSVLVDGDDPKLTIMDDTDRIKVSGNAELSEAILGVDPTEGDEDTVKPEGAPQSLVRFLAQSDIDPPAEETTAVPGGVSVGGQTLRYSEYLLVPGETTYVSGVGRSPNETNRQLPREASALVTNPQTTGLLGSLKERYWPLRFLISDEPVDKAGELYLWKGAGYAIVGAGVAGASGYFLLGVAGFI